MLACALSGAWAQDSSTPPSAERLRRSTRPQQPVPAYGQDNAPPPISENPPLSGLDLPSLEPHAAPLSYLQPGATVSESADRMRRILWAAPEFTRSLARWEA